MNTTSSQYRHLLAAVDLNDSGPPVLGRALQLAALFGARLSVLHVVEYVPIESGDVLVAAPVNLMQEISTQAEHKLHALCEAAGVPKAAASLRHGAIAGEILAAAREAGADLVVVGHSPKRHLFSLFSHTDEDVVAHASCDVLALRLPMPA